MPSTEIIAFGGVVERSRNGTTWTRIAKVKAFGIPQVNQDFQETTSLDSPDGFREYTKGLKDIGEVTIQASYSPAEYETQLADQAFADPIYYRVTMAKSGTQSGGDVATFRGFPVPRITPNGLGEVVNMDIVIRTTGGWTWTKGAGA